MASQLAYAAMRVKTEGVSMRKAALEANLDPSRLWRAVQREEKTGILFRERGRPPLITQHIKDAIFEKITVAAATADAMDNDQIRALATTLVTETHNLPEWVLSPKTYSSLKRDLKTMGIRFGKGTSTSEARMLANSVKILGPWFDLLERYYKR